MFKIRFLTRNTT